MYRRKSNWEFYFITSYSVQVPNALHHLWNDAFHISVKELLNVLRPQHF